MQDLIEKDRIINVLNAYAQACDRRQWQDFDTIFAEDIEVNYGGEFKLKGRDKVVGMIQSMLGGCGPTQHLLGNFFVEVSGSQATCRCYVRAAHAGDSNKGKQELFYEVWAEYKDQLRLTEQGWEITQREMSVYHEVGTRDVLGPL